MSAQDVIVVEDKLARDKVAELMKRNEELSKIVKQQASAPKVYQPETKADQSATQANISYLNDQLANEMDSLRQLHAEDK